MSIFIFIIKLIEIILCLGFSFAFIVSAFNHNKYYSMRFLVLASLSSVFLSISNLVFNFCGVSDSIYNRVVNSISFFILTLVLINFLFINPINKPPKKRYGLKVADKIVHNRDYVKKQLSKIDNKYVNSKDFIYDKRAFLPFVEGFLWTAQSKNNFYTAYNCIKEVSRELKNEDAVCIAFDKCPYLFVVDDKFYTLSFAAEGFYTEPWFSIYKDDKHFLFEAPDWLKKELRNFKPVGLFELFIKSIEED